LDAEVFNFTALKEAALNASEDFEKEHVTPYIYMTKKNHYSIGSYEVKPDGSKYRLTLDEDDDYKAIKEIYKKLDCQTDFSYETLIETMDKNPYISELNIDVEQKKV
jgi:spore coat polysaccharide biosynthesis protein SpsF